MNFFVPKKSCPPPHLNPVSAPDNVLKFKKAKSQTCMNWVITQWTHNIYIYILDDIVLWNMRIRVNGYSLQYGTFLKHVFFKAVVVNRVSSE